MVKFFARAAKWPLSRFTKSWTILRLLIFTLFPTKRKIKLEYRGNCFAVDRLIAERSEQGVSSNIIFVI
jgi:hypothetical protein